MRKQWKYNISIDFIDIKDYTVINQEKGGGRSETDDRNVLLHVFVCCAFLVTAIDDVGLSRRRGIHRLLF